jgi:hypothetical protein
VISLDVRLTKPCNVLRRIPQRVKSTDCRRESSQREYCQGHQEETIRTELVSPSDEGPLEKPQLAERTQSWAARRLSTAGSDNNIERL